MEGSGSDQGRRARSSYRTDGETYAAITALEKMRMPKFLFFFGFCTPAQWKANEDHGWDDESSCGFFVEAETADDAEIWGQEVAECYVERLFRKSNWQGEIPSWKDSWFAYWIENDVGSIPTECLANYPLVTFGKMPHFDEWA